MALQPKSVIDFGCGKGGLVRALREQGIEADGFDPGVKEWQQRPAKTYDLLTCLDVFEHVEPSHLVAMLDELRALADRALMVISHVPAGKRLPDGRNAHLIIKPRNWWEPLIAERWAIESWTEDGGVGTILARKVNNAVA
jgi:cyclopropane fatty-acyl-phospholipid synthase-like methyltransferase